MDTEYTPPSLLDPGQEALLRERGYSDILHTIQILRSRSAKNFGKPYYGVMEEDGTRRFIAFVGMAIPSRQEFDANIKPPSTDPIEKRVHDLETTVSSLASKVADLINQVRTLQSTPPVRRPGFGPY